jgi:protein phosphatase
VEGAHQRVRESHTRGIGSPNMGSTVVAARIDGSAFEIAWVGDSRAYLWDGGAHLLTHDHSLVQRKIDEGILTPEQARVSPERNIITQCLGGSFESKLVVDTVTGQFFEGERLILCSDGLMRDMTDAQLGEVLNRHAGRPDDETAAALIEAAGGTRASDNVTVVVISQHGYPRKAHGRGAFLLGIAVTLIVIVTVAYLGYDGGAPWRDAILKWFGVK